MTKRYNWINTETGLTEYASPVELTKKYQLCKPCMKALAKGFSRKKHYKNWRVINDNQHPDNTDIFGALGSETRAQPPHEHLST